MKPNRLLLSYEIEISSPFPPHNYYLLYDWALPVWKSVASDDAPKDREGFIEYQLSVADTPGIKTWGVYRDHELGGYVSSVRQPNRPWIAQAHCIFSKDFWGGQTTTVALRKVAREIFDDDVMKIEMWVFKDNNAVKGLIRRLGGREEGVLTAQIIRAGEPTDMCVYALTPDSLKGEESNAVRSSASVTASAS